MTQIRIGDAERDSAASALGEHYAAGRLTKDEYDERIDRVWAAKVEDDLVPLFSDLPRRRVPAASARDAVTPTGSGLPKRGSQPYQPAGFHPLMLLAPIAVAAVIAAVIITGAPWVLLLFFFWFFGGMGRRRHRHWTHSR
ncbi:MAG TPA: DUF1707 domain-containing protein [Jiangellaceae bacterium]